MSKTFILLLFLCFHVLSLLAFSLIQPCYSWYAQTALHVVPRCVAEDSTETETHTHG